ncbi:MAG: ParB-like nuclease domain-containing protein [Nocardiopsaceae bacterium]|nr:ParB-like nuclease domain-containing protein [Nocardiopsaceae bacterium]
MTSQFAIEQPEQLANHHPADWEVVSLPIMSIQPGDSPRLNGEDRAHVARLAESEAELPPILVDKRTMKVIDGMHRLMAASLKGHTTIDVVFFDGDPSDAFLRAVRENVTHGLPLSQADRRAAAERIIRSHPNMSDRAIGETAGLAAKTVATIRRSSGEASQSNARVGKDGRVRPLNSDNGRRRAAEILARQPEASLREVASVAGIAPATVMDVRNRLARGESPVPGKPRGGAPEFPGNRGAGQENSGRESGPNPPVPAQPAPRGQVPPRRRGASLSPAAAVEKLLRDPSLRNNDYGRQLLRLLHATASGVDQLPEMTTLVPPHCVLMIAQVAQQHAQAWQDFAAGLTRRGRIIDPTDR